MVSGSFYLRVPMFHILFDEFIEPVTESGCWIWLGTWNPKDYPIIWRHPLRSKRAHRHAYEMTYGEIPEGLQVCHKCDTRQCVNPDHLFLGTNLDNVRDRDRKGRQAKHHKNGNAKLNIDLVKAIRASSDSTEEWSRRTGISSGCLGKARRGDTWKI